MKYDLTDLPKTESILDSISALEREAQCYRVVKNENDFLHQQIERNNGRFKYELDKVFKALNACWYVLEKHSSEIESSRERKIALDLLVEYGLLPKQKK